MGHHTQQLMSYIHLGDANTSFDFSKGIVSRENASSYHLLVILWIDLDSSMFRGFQIAICQAAATASTFSEDSICIARQGTAGNLLTPTRSPSPKDNIPLSFMGH
jgi:hypothetical protein